MPKQWPGEDDLGRRAGSRSHTLLMAGERDLRAGTAAWVQRALVSGSKVLYKGWIRTDRPAHHHWIVADGGAPRARPALDTGQLELLDYPTVLHRTGGRTEGLRHLQHQEVQQALDEGWPSVALTQESTYRPMADQAEATEFGRQEQHYDQLARRWPVTTLCQLLLGDEGDPAVRESVAVHHRDLVAGTWSARTDRERWHLAGELDLAVGREFAAALDGLCRDPARAPGGDVHLDLGEVAFLDVTCAEIVLSTARALPAGRRIILHRAARIVWELLDVLGRPGSVVDARDVTP